MDLQSEHERFLTEEHFKQPGRGDELPKQIKAFYMRLNDDGRTVAARWTCWRPASARSSAAASAKSAWTCSTRASPR
jgi:hypothetical protein